jgi:hypothetical protein
VKLLSITWSHTDDYSLENTFLYKSFIKHNDKNDLVHLHFNRTHYTALENEFTNKYAYQSEYLLYKILLAHEALKKINNLDNFIYADTNDVVVLDKIDKISPRDNVLFSCEKHQYPKNASWLSVNNYPEENYRNNIFLNSGVFVTNKNFFLYFLDSCIAKILPQHFKDYGGDQGVYTFFYLNYNQNKDIDLDVETKYFLSTYIRSSDMFKKNENKLINLEFNTEPIFIHDNGWNYGSPKFIERFGFL